MKPKPIRVLLVDDHALVRAGFRSLLRASTDIKVVAEAGDGRQALRLMKTQRPHVALIDIAMPELNGLEVAAQAAQHFPSVRVVILSMYANEEYVLRALRVGAAGYLLKDADADELELAIRTAARGETYLCPPVSKQIIADYSRRVVDEPDPLERLTPRQREVLQLLAEEQTTKKIAHTLNLSIKTVETHRAQIMERLGIYNIAGLVRFAIRVGLVMPD